MAMGVLLSLTIAAGLISGIVFLDRRDRAVANRIVDDADLSHDVPANA